MRKPYSYLCCHSKWHKSLYDRQYPCKGSSGKNNAGQSRRPLLGSMPLAVAPVGQQDLPFTFLRLAVFLDPPKLEIQQFFKSIYDISIKVKGPISDNEDTAAEILFHAGIINTNLAMN